MALRVSGLAVIMAASVSLMPAHNPLHAAETVEELAPADFDEKVLGSALPASVDFYAGWCGSCKEMRPYYEKVCRELSGKLYCGAYDIDQDDDAGSGPSFTYNARELPTFGFFCHGKHDTVRSFTGKKTEEELRRIMKDFAGSCR